MNSYYTVLLGLILNYLCHFILGLNKNFISQFIKCKGWGLFFIMIIFFITWKLLMKSDTVWLEAI
jgi:hypothetical protein